MALLPPFVLDTVVAIGAGSDKNNITWIGTGFLYGIRFISPENKEEKRYHIFLITNKHVLKDLKNIWIRFNELTGTACTDYPAKIVSTNGRKIWVPHPDPDIDIGALFINPSVLKQQKSTYSYFHSDEHITTKGYMKKKGITEGDGVFVLGYPMGMVSQKRQYVICRTGGIARIRDMLEGRSNDYLVDALVFPGNSGGPVILQPESSYIEGTTPVEEANLIGIVTSYVPYTDIAVSQQTGNPRISFEENSGLTSVLPVDYIHETAELAKNRMKQRQARQRNKKKK